MTENKLLRKIRKDGRKIAKAFKLRHYSIEMERRGIRDRYGSCDEDRVIRIRLHNLKNGRFLSYFNLIHTLCHELAHLNHMNHSKHFKYLNKTLLDWAKQKGIYKRSA